jgi:hypothetical protein
MTLCRQYYENRRAPHAPGRPRRTETEKALCEDKDLDRMDEAALAMEWNALCQAARIHRDLGDGTRTAADDRRLYRALPERIPADQTLPPELLINCSRFISLKIEEREHNPSASLHIWPANTTP